MGCNPKNLKEEYEFRTCDGYDRHICDASIHTLDDGSRVHLRDGRVTCICNGTRNQAQKCLKRHGTGLLRCLTDPFNDYKDCAKGVLDDES